VSTTEHEHPKYLPALLAAGETVSKSSHAPTSPTTQVTERRSPSVLVEEYSSTPSAELILEVLTKAGAVFFRWDVFRGLTFLSANARDMLGYTQEDLLGDPELIGRLIDPEFLADVERLTPGLSIVSTEAVRVEVPLLSRAGARVWIDARIVPEIGEGGRIAGFVGIAFDASEAFGARDSLGPGLD